MTGRHLGVEQTPDHPCASCPALDHPGYPHLTPRHRASIGDEAEMYAHCHDGAVAS